MVLLYVRFGFTALGSGRDGLGVLGVRGRGSLRSSEVLLVEDVSIHSVQGVAMVQSGVAVMTTAA